MSDLATFDQEAPAERLTHRQRAARINAGPRGADYLTDGERQLLNTIREIGFDIQSRVLVDPHGKPYAHKRTVVKAPPSWSHSMR